MPESTQEEGGLSQKEMRLCYVFSSSDTDNRSQVTEHATQFIAENKSEFLYRYLACGTLEKLRPAPNAAVGEAPLASEKRSGQQSGEPVHRDKLNDTDNTEAPDANQKEACDCHPDYLYFMKFRYVALDEVAGRVLAGRKHFKMYLNRSLTLLEYPRFVGDVKARGLTPSEEHPTLQRVGILLIQSKPGSEGISGKQPLAECCNSTDRTCVEVLGPYDYIVEFSADTHEELRVAYESVKAAMGTKCLRIVPMLCNIFHPPPARTAQARSP
jgi:hypothetical protein